MSFTCSNGIGAPVFRGYLRPVQLTDSRVVSVPTTAAGSLQISSASGSVLGLIRTDIQRSIITSIDFNWGENGPGEMNFTLSQLPDIKINEGSQVRFKALNTDYGWFSGTIKDIPQPGSPRDEYTYRATGHLEYLGWLMAGTVGDPVVIESGTDPADVMRMLVQNWVIPYSPLLYSPSAIVGSTGRVTTNDIELSSAPLSEIFDLMADSSDCQWWVDGDGVVWFQPINLPLRRTLFEGYAMRMFSPDRNTDSVRNVITISRNEPKGSGGTGWVVAGVYSDATSVAKYGRKYEEYQVPGWISDDDADNLGDELISRLSEPQQTARIDGVLINSENALWLPGQYRVLGQIKNFWDEYDIADDADDWDTGGTGDLALSDDTTFLTDGFSSILAEFQDAEDQTWKLTKTYNKGLIKKIRFQLRASIAGAYLQFGWGETDFTENLQDIDILFSGQFLTIEINLPDNVREIGEIGFKIKQDMAVATSVWVDGFEVYVRANPTFRMGLYRHGYRFSPETTESWAEFGPPRPRLENYIKALDRQARQFKYTQEVR